MPHSVNVAVAVEVAVVVAIASATAKLVPVSVSVAVGNVPSGVVSSVSTRLRWSDEHDEDDCDGKVH
jgi:hypothetical protein